MEELMAALDRAFTDYRRELEECQRKSKPTDGLLGFGHSIKDSLDILSESHIKHLISLIKNKNSYIVHLHGVASHVIHYSSGCPNNYLHT